MLGEFWHWLWLTDSGLWVRIGCGAAIFACLAMWDFHRHGRQARRWREYVYLLACTAAAILYGIANDQITVTLSWEYFQIFKGLGIQSATRLPEATLRQEAFWLGIRATWAMGLLLGAALLIANNPRKDRPPLPWRTMYRLLPVPLACAAGLAAIGGAALWLAASRGWVPGYVDLGLEPDRQARLACTWGIHLGGYAGGIVGGIATVIHVVRLRGREAASPRRFG